MNGAISGAVIPIRKVELRQLQQADVAAERCVLASVLSSPKLLTAHPDALDVDLYTEERRSLARAMRIASDTPGALVDSLDDPRGLETSARSVQAVVSGGGDRGGMIGLELQTIVRETPVGAIALDMDRLRELRAVRASLDALHVAEGRILGGDRPAIVLADFVGGIDATMSGPRSGFVKVDAAGIFEPLPPIPWLVQGLDLCPGPPAMIAGDAFVRKTISAQDAAVSIAAGRPVWGWFRCRQGRVLHVDHEQGSRLTRERYQRLVRAAGLAPEELAGKLDLVVLPEIYLDSPNAQDVYVRECEGYAMVVIDSFRAAAPTVDENDSKVRQLLDMLMRVSERTGVVPLVIHHARKPFEGQKGGSKSAVRGSGAIGQALSSLLVFAADEGEPTKVHHVKARTSGICTEPFYLETRDVEIDGDPRAGLAVEYKTIEQIDPPSRPDAKYLAALTRTEATIRSEPGLSLRKLRALVGGTGTNVDAALEHLLESGKVVNAGTDTRPAYRLV